MEVLSTSGKVAVASFVISSSIYFPATQLVAPTQVSLSSARAGNQTSMNGLDVERFIIASPGQAYYWTDKWQAGERAASEDIKHGRTHEFSSAEDAIAWLFDD